MRVIIELDFKSDSEEEEEEDLKEQVYTYLRELIEDDALDFTIVSE